MSWTTPAELKEQVQRLWDRGPILASLVTGEALFPHRLSLRTPSSADIGTRLPEVQRWVAELRRRGPYRVVMRDVFHSVAGRNAMPDEAWVDSLAEALAWIGRTREARRFTELLALTRQRLPQVVPLLAKRPFAVLEADESWGLLLDAVEWMRLHPDPGVYLRQVGVRGLHGKVLQDHLELLAHMAALALPSGGAEVAVTTPAEFLARWGFRTAPERIRFRMLDRRLNLVAGGNDQDVALDLATFGAVGRGVSRVFVTNSETNFLSLPELPGSMAVFGGGDGLSQLAAVSWMHAVPVHYWGDIDTQGFALLDQLRSALPQVESLLMDRATLLHHRDVWVTEPRQHDGALSRLTADELSLCGDLRSGSLGTRVRLEQERVDYAWLEAALGRLTFTLS